MLPGSMGRYDLARYDLYPARHNLVPEAAGKEASAPGKPRLRTASDKKERAGPDKGKGVLSFRVPVVFLDWILDR